MTHKSGVPRQHLQGGMRRRGDATARTSKLVLGFPPVLRGSEEEVTRRPQRRLTTPASAAASVPDMPAGISPDPPVLSPTDMWVHEPSRAPCIDEEDDDSRRTALCRCGDQPSSDPNGPVKQPPDLGPPGPSPARTPMVVAATHIAAQPPCLLTSLCTAADSPVDQNWSACDPAPRHLAAPTTTVRAHRHRHRGATAIRAAGSGPAWPRSGRTTSPPRPPPPR